VALCGPPVKVEVPDERRVLAAVWQARIETLLGSYPRLLAVSVHHELRAEGFEGSYPTVVRAVRDVRGPRFRAAAAVSVPIHTDPGEEDQFDFCNLDDVARGWGWEHPLRCFGAISCWPRQRMWWFTTSEDQHHTFEGLVRTFEAFGGVPAAARTDRMGALGSSQGRRFRLHPATVAFAAHHGVRITSCQAGDAKRKGKAERPFRQLRDTFLTRGRARRHPRRHR
jgi:transposase